MKVPSKRQVKELVLYSLQHIDRLEKAGKFPKRVGDVFGINQHNTLWRQYLGF